MRFISRIGILPAAVAACGIATGCFSYHKTVDETSALVVETAPRTTVVSVPATSSSTTTHNDRQQRNSGAAKDFDLHRTILESATWI